MVMSRITIAALALLAFADLPAANDRAEVEPGRAEPDCGGCHAEALQQHWAASAHAQGGRNPIFLSLYYGTGAGGTSEPGYKLDFPDTVGSCAACHSPGEALNDLLVADLDAALHDGSPGVHCRFCHDVASIELDAITGRPRVNMPGIFSIELERSGPARCEEVGRRAGRSQSWARRSEVCAPCHDAGFWGTPIYASFAEWKASPYAARGQTCQDCHMRSRRMPAGGARQSRPGASDQTRLRQAVDTRVTTKRDSGYLEAEVSITNGGAGHHMPTGSPLRNLILVVRATDEQGRPLRLAAGPTVPDWGGEGDASTGHYAGLPGKGFAKILRETWSGASPSAAYWNPTSIASDNRIAALATDTSNYLFLAPDRGQVRVDVTLLFRRAFIELAERKGWELQDVVLTRQSLTVDAPGGVRR